MITVARLAVVNSKYVTFWGELVCRYVATFLAAFLPHLSSFFLRVLTQMPGQSCGSEVTNLIVTSNKRADVALYKGLYNVLTDVPSPVATRAPAALRH